MKMIERHSPYMRNGLRLLLVDRGVLFVDFFIATGVAFCIQFLIWTTIYTDDQEIHGFSFNELMFYCGLTIFLSRLNNCYDLIEEMAQEIIDGQLEVLMARPNHYLAQKFFAYLGGGAIYVVPVLLLCLWYVCFHTPAALTSPAMALAYVLILLAFLLLGTILSFCIGMILAMTTCWLMQPDFILACLTTVVAFLGGAIIPPSFWPAFIRPVMEYNPFQYFVAAPANFMIHADMQAGLTSLLGAALYVLVMYCFMCWLWRRALNTYSGGGG